MNIRNAVLFLPLFALLGCQAEAPVSADAKAERPIPEAQLVPAQEPTVPGSQTPNSGQWTQERGVQICDGYLTRVESEEFCAPKVPDDWSAFEFDGNDYYVQPLAAQNGSEE